jgi:hypothetical protein
MKIFRSKLKNMARVVTDYPELKHMIGSMDLIDPQSSTLMSTRGTRGGNQPAEFRYNKRLDREGIWGDLDRDIKDEQNKHSHFHISPREYEGTHELGHAMASLLVEDTGARERYFRMTNTHNRIVNKANGIVPRPFMGGGGSPMSNQIGEETYELPENDMLESVLAKDNFRIMKQYNISKLHGMKQDKTENGHDFLKGQMNTRELFAKGVTSGYGSSSAGELFAEAVSDVYSHGSSAKDVSKELVKEYEGRQKKMVRERFDRNKKTWWQRLFGW